MTSNNAPPGRLIIDLEATELTAAETELLRHPSLAGLILFSRNYRSPTQLAELCAAVRQIRPELLITVDQEGGRVQRFRSGFCRLPPLHVLASGFEADSDGACQRAWHCAWLMAAEVMACGVDLSFAPVLDLFSAASEVIADRAFAGDVEVTSILAQAYIAGLHAAGMSATGKHFPGHGSVEADSHVKLPVDARPAQEILGRDYQVFSNCIAHLDAIMPAHVRYPALDPECAGFSSFWLQQKLRSELGFEGVIFSDDLSMVAAHSAGNIEQRAEKALAAGCDVLLACNDRETAIALLHWLERQDLGVANKLSTLKGTSTLSYTDLHEQPQWQQAQEMLASLPGYSQE